MSQVTPINENPPSQEGCSDKLHHTSEPNPPAVTCELDAEKDGDNQTNESNVRIVNQPGLSVRDVCKKKYNNKMSNEIGTFDNRIRNVKNAFSSIPRIQVALGDVLTRLANAEKKPGSQPQTDDGIIRAVEEIIHNMNIVMESSFTTNAELVYTIETVYQDDLISGQYFKADKEGRSHPRASKTAINTQKKRATTSASR